MIAERAAALITEGDRSPTAAEALGTTV
jgi:hypothetical protein